MMALESVLSVLSFDDKSLVVIACVSGVVVTMIQCTVKPYTDIINFACMTWNFVRISASLSALCTNFECQKENSIRDPHSSQ